MEPEIRYCATSDGVSIAYYAMGEGETVVIASQILWSNLRYSPAYLPEYHRSGEGIGRGMRIVRYDPRGAGMSDRSALDFTLEARLRDLSAVVEKAAPPTFTLLAPFHGAMHGVHYAARHPERVTKLVLLTPIVDGRAMREKTRRWDSLRNMAAEEWADYTLTMAAANYGYDDPELLQTVSSRMREGMSPSAVQAYHEVMSDIDATPELSQLKMPVLLLFLPLGGRSTAEEARRIAAAIPDCETLITDDPPVKFWGREENEALERFLEIAPAEPDAAAAPSTVARRTSTGLQTIIFTDIEANTALLQRVGDAAWRDILRDCEQTTRSVLAVHHGTEIKVMGDAFMASFASAIGAIECAVALQRAFSDGDTSGHGLRVRIGINAGEPIAEDDDLFGTAVTMASRIQSLATGGEILVADVVRQLVAGKGFLFHDRGETALRGFEDPVRLYEVRWQE